MKKFISSVCALILLSSVLAGCNNSTNPAQTDAPAEPTATAENVKKAEDVKVTEETDFVTEKWIAIDIAFTATKEIKEIQDAELDVTFTNRTSGTKMVMPAFWDGGTSWIVRFAPTECGVWDYATSTSGDDIGLDGLKGTLASNPYTGDLLIYKHGFVKTQKDTRYFVYDDGTPFFYLGDTHWAMLKEEIDEAGKNAADVDTDSHFKYIVDRRVAQKFTVYQSEPIGHTFDVTNGITKADIKGFQTDDRYFAYIAQSGLVHANAQFMFPSEITQKFFTDNDFLRSISRYWVARYAAYPVMWTLGQEIDNDYFGNNGITTTNNPYRMIAKYINECDPYKHPLTGHQENAVNVTAKGGVEAYDATWGKKDTKTSERSVFYGNTWHDWYGSQWRPAVGEQYIFDTPRDYWENDTKVTINYESRYDMLYTKRFGARANGWISFLSGMYGYGYGAADIWCYLSTYSFDSESTDGVETVTTTEKKMPWGEAVFLPASDDMTRMRGFLEAAGWWKLVPDFEGKNAYKADKSATDVFYAVAHDGNDVYVAYLYNQSEKTAGSFVNMDDSATYTVQWFNPETGEYTLVSDSVKSSGGTYNLPAKPAALDMVLLVTKNA